MIRYALSPLALQDLADIWEYIARDSSEAADSVVVKIRQEVRKLAELPRLGHWRDDLPFDDLRAWRVYSFLIIYRIADDELQVVRIIHGSQDLPNTL